MFWMLPLAGLWCAWRWIEPYYYIEDLDFSHSEHIRESMETDEDRLINMGPRAIDPIIDKMRGGAFDWETWDLMWILKRSGETAHKRLLFRIDHDALTAEDRIGLIYTLQTSFDDYSRVNLWLDYVQYPLHPNSEDLRKSLKVHFPDVPVITNDYGMVTEEFCDWYRKTSAAGKGLPGYQFYVQQTTHPTQ